MSDSPPTRPYTPAQQALLDEHESDRCEHLMGECLGGCPPPCPPAYCTSERHKGDLAPAWPCNVVAPILGFRNAEAYWEAENEALLAYYETATKGSSSHVEPSATKET